MKMASRAKGVARSRRSNSAGSPGVVILNMRKTMIVLPRSVGMAIRILRIMKPRIEDKKTGRKFAPLPERSA